MPIYKAKRVPRSRKNIIARNNAVEVYHAEMSAKHNGKYRSTYIVELVAEKFYLSSSQVYFILRNKK